MIETLTFVFTLISLINVEATLDKNGHAMLITYDIQEISKRDAIHKVDIWFHVRGSSYLVATHRYPEPVTSISDTFPWFSKSKWEGGDLEVVFYRGDGSKVSRYISESSIQVKDLRRLFPFPTPDEKDGYINWSKVRSYQGSDPYAWRMLGYDPGHTGYYPFHLYPPLEMKWILDEWGYPGCWITNVSAAAGHDMLFIPRSVTQWNILTARDVETGEVIWEKYVTANVWTSALSLGDSILFVGTSIGFTPWQDTTFYAFDPFTGELKWGKVFKTVEYSPIVADSLVYAPSLGLPAKLGCWNYEGDSVWTVVSWMSDGAPAYDDGVVLHTGLDTLIDPYVLDSTLYARDYLTGELIWDLVESGWILNLLAYENKVIFSPFFDPLYALDIHTGDMVWTSYSYNPIVNVHTSGSFSIVHWAHSQYHNDTLATIWFTIDANTGEFLWDTLLMPADTNSGRTTLTLSSKDSLFWITNCSRIYVFKSHVLLYVYDLPESPAIWPSWNFPIFYKNYFIYAHEDFLLVYEADTVRDTSGNNDTLVNFALYAFNRGGRNFLRLSIPEDGLIQLSLYSVSGSKVWNFQSFLEKGKHDLPLPDLPSGVYLLKYSLPANRGVKKLVLIKK
jgi:outer membrane protein assembly factor BamB